MYRRLLLTGCVLCLAVAAVAPAQSGVNDGLVAYFKLDETSGTTAADFSGRGNDGTVIGTNVTWVEGRDGGALLMSPPATADAPDRLEFPTAGMSPTAGTVSVWLYLSDPQPASSGRYIFGHTSNGTARTFADRFQIYMQDGSNVSRKLEPGWVALTASRRGATSNPLPFVLDTLPEAFEREPNNIPQAAQQMTLPVIINGRIERIGDWDVFQFNGKANSKIAIEVQARQLESPLDSTIKLTDATGKVLAFNDDCEDLTSGTNTHHADSYLLAELPADANYFVHIGDTARHAGEAYSYRLRLSPPQPDFQLRATPSSIAMSLRGGNAQLTVYAMRKDGFAGPIKVMLDDPPPGITAVPITIPADQTSGKITIKGSPSATTAPVKLHLAGRATIGSEERIRHAVPAEDRMQAFLWRHLVPATELIALVFDPSDRPVPKRTAPPPPPAPPPATTPPPDNPKVNKQQIAGRLRQLARLYEEDLLTDSFYNNQVAACQAAQ